ncbi:hypothetical protein ARTSIC4J27_1323 [Pseudarthrobacter siccitolerans]|uniref:Uncharacterized protein n=1 Tax=Pseudarthrobacter siccitolerans TaxID=861266 RepID=A0A024H051_9MICC|nr:hypothetical protein ARTSIC4J27_1323 [Pseudarthrobacter siccitolerans]
MRHAFQPSGGGRGGCGIVLKPWKRAQAPGSHQNQPRTGAPPILPGLR